MRVRPNAKTETWIVLIPHALSERVLAALTQELQMHHHLQTPQHSGHPALLCYGSYGNLIEHQMFHLKCEGIICDTALKFTQLLQLSSAFIYRAAATVCNSFPTMVMRACY